MTVQNIFGDLGVKKYDFHDCIIGHLHTDSVVNLYNGGRMYVNGSLIGTSEFSLYNVKSVSKIVQIMIVVNSYHNVHALLPLYGEWSNGKVINDE
jgi:DNA repair exonuclease SbcCD nuclease subunit